MLAKSAYPVGSRPVFNIAIELTQPWPIFTADEILEMLSSPHLPIDSTDNHICQLLLLFDDFSTANRAAAREAWSRIARTLCKDAPESVTECDTVVAEGRLRGCAKAMVQRLNDTGDAAASWKLGELYISAVLMTEDDFG